jgi:hypothetical protein
MPAPRQDGSRFSVLGSRFSVLDSPIIVSLFTSLVSSPDPTGVLEFRQSQVAGLCKSGHEGSAM